MLLPKFSIRSMLLLTVAAGFVFLIASQAIQGQAWAIAFTVAVLGVLLTFLTYAVVFLIAVPFSLMGKAMQPPPTPTSPFATQRPPPQIMPPLEPE